MLQKGASQNRQYLLRRNSPMQKPSYVRVDTEAEVARLWNPMIARLVGRGLSTISRILRRLIRTCLHRFESEAARPLRRVLRKPLPRIPPHMFKGKVGPVTRLRGRAAARFRDRSCRNCGFRLELKSNLARCAVTLAQTSFVSRTLSVSNRNLLTLWPYPRQCLIGGSTPYKPWGTRIICGKTSLFPLDLLERL